MAATLRISGLIVAAALGGCGGDSPRTTTPPVTVAAPASPVRAFDSNDEALERAARTFERYHELSPEPRVFAVLALAWERVGRLDDARRALDRLRGEALEESLQARLVTLDERLAAQARGEPHVDDPELREALIELAEQIDRRVFDRMGRHVERPYR